MRELFLLDPDVVFLNHGSFGATPRPVFEAYQASQRELERQPVELLRLSFQGYDDESDLERLLEGLRAILRRPAPA